MPTYTDSARGVVNAAITEPTAIVYVASLQGTVNTTIGEPAVVPPSYSPSLRGTVNATITQPGTSGGSTTYSNSNRGKVNVVLREPASYSFWNIVGGVRKPMVLRTGDPHVVAGAAPLGSVSYPIPTTGPVMYVDPILGNDAAAGTFGAPKRTIIAASNAIKGLGTASLPATVILRAGTYHEGGYQPGNGYVLRWQPYPGEVARLDGSSVFTGPWTNNGNGTWFAAYTAPTIPAIGNDKIGDDPNALLPDMLFYDGVEMYQIADGGTPGAGQFAVNRGANTVTIGSNPVGHEVRYSDTVYLAQTGSRIDLLGLGIRRYRCVGNTLHTCIYYGGFSEGTIIENCRFEQLGRVGMYVGKDGSRLTRNTFLNINQTAILGGDLDDLIIENCRIEYTNTGKWKAQPTSGAIKLTVAQRPILRNNILAHCHNGNLIWWDVSCSQVSCSGNYLDGVSADGTTYADSGICYEECDGGYWGGVQYKSLIVGNTVVNCHKTIVICASGQVIVANNTIQSRWIARTEQALLFLQDRDVNHGQQVPLANVPWWNTGIVAINNRVQPQLGGWQLLAYDSQGEVPRPRAIAAGYGTAGQGQQVGGLMLERFGGNWMAPSTGTGSVSTMATIGKADGARLNFQTPAALAVVNATYGLGSNIETNYQSATDPVTTDDHATSVPLPAAVATLLGMSTGSHYVGNPLPKPTVED